MTVDHFVVREEPSGSGAICREILAELPDWFGIPEAVEHYVEVADRSLTMTAVVDEEVAGFLTIVEHDRYAAEIYVMGVRPSRHRQGVGRRLIEHAEEVLVARGVEYLQVKTLSKKRPDPHYAATRAFYVACGFRPLEELPTLWGPENPALLMIKRLAPEEAVSALHHVEMWVPDLGRAVESWGWLLRVLDFQPYQEWSAGRSWRRHDLYVVVEQSPALSAAVHERCRPGLNHLAFHAGDLDDVDRIAAEASAHGWTLLFPERHPHAGGEGHYAAYLEDADGFEVELVAKTHAATS